MESYEDLCRAHFKWWGCGAVKIEVVDIDRFNENIFMGEVGVVLFSLALPYYLLSYKLIIIVVSAGYFTFIFFVGSRKRYQLAFKNNWRVSFSEASLDGQSFWFHCS